MSPRTAPARQTPAPRTPTTPTLADRAAGLLLHPTSLPGGHGQGDLGASAFAFAEFLAAAGQRWWQMLPVHPVGQGYSPYNGLSAFAGAPHLVALEPLVAQGWLTAREAAPPNGGRADRHGSARFAVGLRFRLSRLRKAFRRFEARAGAADRAALAAFEQAEADWLPDYALFAALKRARRGAHWVDWPADLRDRAPAALRRAREALADELRLQAFVQWQFARQWDALRAHCHALGIALLGDVPIFVAHDSADAWARRELFFMAPDGSLPIVAGVPPDAFSDTGQRWGNPLYDWERQAATGYAWWQARLGATLRRFDAARLDHFIGFVRYWAIPASHPDARQGSFEPGPGAAFLRTIQSGLGRLPLIAEDLGLVIPAVTELREAFGLPGMRVLQFAFDGDDPANPHLPGNHEPNSVVYTGTHDNDTVVGWARGGDTPGDGRSLTDSARRALAAQQARAAQQALESAQRAARTARDVHWALIELAHASVANLAIVPVQDVLGLDATARMNRPGTPTGNWGWRLAPGALTTAHAARLRTLTERHGRTGGGTTSTPSTHATRSR